MSREFKNKTKQNTQKNPAKKQREKKAVICGPNRSPHTGSLKLPSFPVGNCVCVSVCGVLISLFVQNPLASSSLCDHKIEMSSARIAARALVKG